MENKDEDRKKIETLLSRDLESLLISLASPESAEKVGVRYVPGEELETGIKIFNKLSGKLRRRICVEWEYCKKRKMPEFSDKIHLIAVIADIISGIVIGFSPYTLAVILFMKGLDKYCECK
jgi:hypothetical protein